MRFFIRGVIIAVVLGERERERERESKMTPEVSLVLIFEDGQRGRQQRERCDGRTHEKSGKSSVVIQAEGKRDRKAEEGWTKEGDAPRLRRYLSSRTNRFALPSSCT